MSHQTHNDDRDYPVIDRVHDDEPDEPTLVDRDPDGTEADADAEAEYRAARPDDDGTTILPVDPSYDSTGTEATDTDRDGDGVPDDADVVVIDVTDANTDANTDDVTDDVTDDDTDDEFDDDDFDADGAPAHRADTTGDATVIAVDDVAAQDPGVVVVPPVTDDADSALTTDPDATPGPAAEVVPVPVPVGTGSARDDDGATAPGAGGDERWRELQLTFVDDPASAVREAADLLEQAIADLRQRYEGSDSTEDLRTAFRRYRDVYRSLTG